MTKLAARETAGVLGDDLALNAQQVSRVRAERELPVVGAVALGSLKNKVILVPTALAISAAAPWDRQGEGAWLGFQQSKRPARAKQPSHQPLLCDWVAEFTLLGCLLAIQRLR